VLYVVIFFMGVWTTVRLRKDLVERFRVFKVHPRESDDECLSRLFDRFDELFEVVD